MFSLHVCSTQYTDVFDKMSELFFLHILSIALIDYFLTHCTFLKAEKILQTNYFLAKVGRKHVFRVKLFTWAFLFHLSLNPLKTCYRGQLRWVHAHTIGIHIRMGSNYFTAHPPVTLLWSMAAMNTALSSFLLHLSLEDRLSLYSPTLRPQKSGRFRDCLLCILVTFPEWKWQTKWITNSISMSTNFISILRKHHVTIHPLA